MALKKGKKGGKEETSCFRRNFSEGASEHGGKREAKKKGEIDTIRLLREAQFPRERREQNPTDGEECRPKRGEKALRTKAVESNLIEKRKKGRKITRATGLDVFREGKGELQKSSNAVKTLYIRPFWPGKGCRGRSQPEHSGRKEGKRVLLSATTTVIGKKKKPRKGACLIREKKRPLLEEQRQKGGLRAIGRTIPLLRERKKRV